MVVLAKEQRRDVVGVQHAILTGIGGEGVHLGVIHLQSTVGCNPQITRMVAAKCVDMVVYQCLHAVACH